MWESFPRVKFDAGSAKMARLSETPVRWWKSSVRAFGFAPYEKWCRPVHEENCGNFWFVRIERWITWLCNHSKFSLHNRHFCTTIIFRNDVTANYPATIITQPFHSRLSNRASRTIKNPMSCRNVSRIFGELQIFNQHEPSTCFLWAGDHAEFALQLRTVNTAGGISVHIIASPIMRMIILFFKLQEISHRSHTWHQYPMIQLKSKEKL